MKRYKVKINFNKLNTRLKSLLIILPIISIGFISAYTIMKYIAFNPNEISFKTSSSKIYDKNGTFLWEVSEDNSIRNTPIELGKIPQSCKDGIIAIEDKYFRSNIGVDLNGFGRLAISLFTNGSLGGGSTITQQVIKTTNQKIYGRTPVDKLNEIGSAIKLTQIKSKDEILNMYLNNVYFGNLNYGIESASQDYYNKSVSELNIAECSYLVGIPQWPGVYNPQGNIKKGKERQSLVLESMLRDRYITQAERDDALSYDLNFNTKGFEVKAPHFVQFVKDNFTHDDAIDFNIYDSYSFYTTYDYELHKKALEISKSWVGTFKDQNVNNAAVVILDKDNDLLTMVGSVNFFDDEIQGKFNSALGFRQPGNLYIPLVYLYSINRGKTLETNISNQPIDVSILKESINENITITDGSFSGIATIQESLLKNYKPAAVRLTQEFGAKNIIAYLENDLSYYKYYSANDFDAECNDIMILEGCELSLLDLSLLYSSIRNNGESTTLKYISSYQKNNQAFSTREESIKFERDEFKQLKDVLDNNKLNDWYFQNGDVRNNKDLFTIGFNEKFTVGVWMGNTKGEEFENIKSSISTQKVFEELIQLL